MPSAADGARRKEIETRYAWAIEIVARHFRTGLEQVFERQRIRRQVDRFVRHGDPVYSRLLRSSGTDLYETFAGFWKLGQTLATQSRFWLERAICDVVRHQPRFGTRVYSLSDLASGRWMQNGELAFMGDEETEWDATTRAFRVPLSRNLLDYVEREVGRQDRRAPLSPVATDRGRASLWAEMARDDTAILRNIAGKLSEPPWLPVAVQCNLLVVEPEPGGVWAFRFINDKSLSVAQARREMANVLRLFGWLSQEKILRRPDRMTAVVAELLPRWHDYPAERGSEMFSDVTWRSHRQFWKFVDVPFEAVEIAMERVGQELRGKLMASLSTIVPRP